VWPTPSHTPGCHRRTDDSVDCVTGSVAGNGHSQLPLAELGKPSPSINLLRTTGSNGRACVVEEIL